MRWFQSSADEKCADTSKWYEVVLRLLIPALPAVFAFVRLMKRPKPEKRNRRLPSGSREVFADESRTLPAPKVERRSGKRDRRNPHVTDRRRKPKQRGG